MNQLSDTLSTLSQPTQHLLADVMGLAVHMFADHGQVEPCLFIPKDGDKIEYMPTKELMNDDLKPILWDFVRSLRREHHIVAFISEVWMAKAGPGDFNPDGSVKVMPRNNPKKTEMAILQLWEGSRSVTFKAEITRNPNKMGEWEVFFDSAFPVKGGPHHLEGAMMDGQPCALEGN